MSRARGNEKIFVQVPSYRDSQLGATIEDMMENSSDASRLNVVICWQHSKNEKLPAKIKKNKNIRIIDVDYHSGKGTNWARREIQRLWNNETYSFLMDSHLRFVRDWDRKLVDMLLFLKHTKNISKPVISGFPPSFSDPEHFPKKRMNYPVKTYPLRYEDNLLIKFQGRAIPHFRWLTEPVKAEFLAMNFLFSEGVFNKEIPFDPNIYFFGDDITTGLRAFCHGYDFFHPHRIIAWHLYDRKTRITHWHDHKNWESLEDRSIKRIAGILRGKNFPAYPLGSVRTIMDYEKFIHMKLIQS